MAHRILPARQNINRIQIQLTRQVGVVHYGIAYDRFHALLHVYDP